MTVRVRIICGAAATAIVIGACGSAGSEPSTDEDVPPTEPSAQALRDATPATEAPTVTSGGSTLRYR